jgi:hypothetical protein
MCRTRRRNRKIWIEQSEAAKDIEAEFGKQKALDYLVGEKLLNFIEAAETDKDFRAEIPAFVAKIKSIFAVATGTISGDSTGGRAFRPDLFEPRDHPILGKEEIEFDADEIEGMRKDDIRQ